jgi:hypothetical protein
MSRNEETFRALLKNFVVQSVMGVYTSHIIADKLDQLGQVSAIYLYTNVYLNKCWHGYGQRNDEYVVNAFDDILGCHVIKGPVCLINWIQMFGVKIINGINMELFKQMISYLGTIEDKRNFVRMMVSLKFDEHCSSVSHIMCDGSENCDNEYDGNDIFRLSVEAVIKK